MQAVTYLGPADIQVAQVPEPRGAGALIEIEACGICGTDLAIAKGAHPRAQPGLILGHEFVGRLAEATAGFAKGTRVTAFPLITCGACEACRSGRAHICARLNLYGIDAAGGMAEAVRIPEALLLEVPEALPAEVAAQIEPLAVCVRAARQAGIDLSPFGNGRGDSVLILGAGPIGVTLALVLRRLGYHDITLAEVNPVRQAAASALGFTTLAPEFEALAPDLQAQSREGFDLVFDCAGVPAAAELALSLTRSGGRLTMVAVHKTPVQLDLRDLNFREITLIGTRVYTREDYALALDWIEAMAAPLAKLVTRYDSFAAAPEVFEALLHGAPDLKVVLHP